LFAICKDDRRAPTGTARNCYSQKKTGQLPSTISDANHLRMASETCIYVTSGLSKFHSHPSRLALGKKLAARKDARCVLDIPAPHRVELYPIQVAFDYIGPEEERAWFKSLPTSFEQPRATVDKLRAVGRRLLSEDPKYQQLMRQLHGSLAEEINGR